MYGNGSVPLDSAVHSLHLHQNDAIKARFTHPNPSFFVRKCGPGSIYEHNGVLRVASVLFFAVKVAFLTVWMRGYCVFKLKPIDWNKIHPSIHPINPSFDQQSLHDDTKLKLYGQYLASSGHEYRVTMAFGGQKKAVLHLVHCTHILPRRGHRL